MDEGEHGAKALFRGFFDPKDHIFPEDFDQPGQEQTLDQYAVYKEYVELLESKLTELISINGADGQAMTPEVFVAILEHEKDNCPFPIKEIE